MERVLCNLVKQKQLEPSNSQKKASMLRAYANKSLNTYCLAILLQLLLPY